MEEENNKKELRMSIKIENANETHSEDVTNIILEQL